MKNTNDKLTEAILEFGKATALTRYIGLHNEQIIAGNFTTEELEIVSSALSEGVPMERKIKFNEEAEKDLIASVRRIIDVVKMAQGYEEMHDINLKMSHDFFYVEDEGEKMINEMGNEDTDKEA